MADIGVVGRLEPEDAPRYWITLKPTEVTTDPHDYYESPTRLTLPAGVSLRYDQADFFDHREWGWEWHRFCVLDGEFAGLCVQYGVGRSITDDCQKPSFPRTIRRSDRSS